MSQAEIKKTADEIQRAHDVLVSALFAVERGVGTMPAEVLADVLAHAAVLCWVLGHEHNANFADHLAAVDKCLRDAGFSLIDMGDLHTPGAVQ